VQWTNAYRFGKCVVGTGLLSVSYYMHRGFNEPEGLLNIAILQYERK